MELKDTVSLFSTEVFSDVFNPLTTFAGKLNPFAEVANSGASARRRILETPTTEVIPDGRVIKSPNNDIFIVALPNVDYWMGEAIRHKYSILPPDGMAAVGTIGEALASAQADTQVYTYLYFVRRESDAEEMSDHFTGYELYFSKVKSFTRGDILSLGSQIFRMVTDSWIDGAGYGVVQAVKLENPLQTFDISLQVGEYDPVTDSYPPVTVADVSCFVEPLKQDYEFVTPSFVEIQEGDKAISVLKSAAAVDVGDHIGEFRIQSIRNFSTWVTCQCRYLS